MKSSIIYDFSTKEVEERFEILFRFFKENKLMESEVKKFMFMYSSSKNTIEILAFKHIYTRGYLFIDKYLNSYTYTQEGNYILQ